MRNPLLSQQPYLIVVEQEEVADSFIQFHCRRAGCEVDVADTGDQFVHLTDARIPDLFVINWTGDKALSRELFRFIRGDELLASTPILHYGSEQVDTEIDVQIAVPVCAEAFSHILFKTLEFQRLNSPSVIELVGIRLDVSRGSVSVANEELRLGSTEIRLLATLLSNPDITLNRSQLLDRAWGRARDIEERTVDVHISRIRNRLSVYGLHHQIQTIRGIGYRFVSERI